MNNYDVQPEQAPIGLLLRFEIPTLRQAVKGLQVPREVLLRFTKDVLLFTRDSPLLTGDIPLLRIYLG